MYRESSGCINGYLSYCESNELISTSTSGQKDLEKCESFKLTKSFTCIESFRRTGVKINSSGGSHEWAELSRSRSANFCELSNRIAAGLLSFSMKKALERNREE